MLRLKDSCSAVHGNRTMARCCVNVSCIYLFGYLLTALAISEAVAAQFAVPPHLVRTRHHGQQQHLQLKSAKLPENLTRSLSVSEYENLLRSPHVRNVTTQVGQTVYLHCIVDHVGEGTVSWIRMRDFHLLTVGLVTYTSDDRFLMVHMQYSNNWALQVKYAQLKDQGLYECVVSSDPPARQLVFLKVVEPEAFIVGQPDLHVEAGSAINLTCVIRKSPEPPAFVFWYHNKRMINFGPADVTIAKADNDSAFSRLVIRSAELSDSGNYTCCPANTNSTSIMVHVHESHRRLAAVQNDAGSALTSSCSTPPISRVILIFSATLLQYCNRR